jgi:hypothetical protein
MAGAVTHPLTAPAALRLVPRFTTFTHGDFVHVIPLSICCHSGEKISQDPSKGRICVLPQTHSPTMLRHARHVSRRAATSTSFGSRPRTIFAFDEKNHGIYLACHSKVLPCMRLWPRVTNIGNSKAQGLRLECCQTFDGAQFLSLSAIMDWYQARFTATSAERATWEVYSGHIHC